MPSLSAIGIVFALLPILMLLGLMGFVRGVVSIFGIVEFLWPDGADGGSSGSFPRVRVGRIWTLLSGPAACGCGRRSSRIGLALRLEDVFVRLDLRGSSGGSWLGEGTSLEKMIDDLVGVARAGLPSLGSLAMQFPRRWFPKESGELGKSVALVFLAWVRWMVHTVQLELRDIRIEVCLPGTDVEVVVKSFGVSGKDSHIPGSLDLNVSVGMVQARMRTATLQWSLGVEAGSIQYSTAPPAGDAPWSSLVSVVLGEGEVTVSADTTSSVGLRVGKLLGKLDVPVPIDGMPRGNLRIAGNEVQIGAGGGEFEPAVCCGCVSIATDLRPVRNRRAKRPILRVDGTLSSPHLDSRGCLAFWDALPVSLRGVLLEEPEEQVDVPVSQRTTKLNVEVAASLVVQGASASLVVAGRTPQDASEAVHIPRCSPLPPSKSFRSVIHVIIGSVSVTAAIGDEPKHTAQRVHLHTSVSDAAIWVDRCWPAAVAKHTDLLGAVRVVRHRQVWTSSHRPLHIQSLDSYICVSTARYLYPILNGMRVPSSAQVPSPVASILNPVTDDTPDTFQRRPLLVSPLEWPPSHLARTGHTIDLSAVEATVVACAASFHALGAAIALSPSVMRSLLPPDILTPPSERGGISVATGPHCPPLPESLRSHGLAPCGFGVLPAQELAHTSSPPSIAELDYTLDPERLELLSPWCAAPSAGSLVGDIQLQRCQRSPHLAGRATGVNVIFQFDATKWQPSPTSVFNLDPTTPLTPDLSEFEAGDAYDGGRRPVQLLVGRFLRHFARADGADFCVRPAPNWGAPSLRPLQPAWSLRVFGARWTRHGRKRPYLWVGAVQVEETPMRKAGWRTEQQAAVDIIARGVRARWHAPLQTEVTVGIARIVALVQDMETEVRRAWKGRPGSDVKGLIQTWCDHARAACGGVSAEAPRLHRLLVADVVVRGATMACALGSQRLDEALPHGGVVRSSAMGIGPKPFIVDPIPLLVSVGVCEAPELPCDVVLRDLRVAVGEAAQPQSVELEREIDRIAHRVDFGMRRRGYDAVMQEAEEEEGRICEEKMRQEWNEKDGDSDSTVSEASRGGDAGKRRRRFGTAESRRSRTEFGDGRVRISSNDEQQVLSEKAWVEIARRRPLLCVRHMAPAGETSDPWLAQRLGARRRPFLRVEKVGLGLRVLPSAELGGVAAVEAVYGHFWATVFSAGNAIAEKSVAALMGAARTILPDAGDERSPYAPLSRVFPALARASRTQLSRPKGPLSRIAANVQLEKVHCHVPREWEHAVVSECLLSTFSFLAAQLQEVARTRPSPPVSTLAFPGAGSPSALAFRARDVSVSIADHPLAAWLKHLKPLQDEHLAAREARAVLRETQGTSVFHTEEQMNQDERARDSKEWMARVRAFLSEAALHNQKTEHQDSFPTIQEQTHVRPLAAMCSTPLLRLHFDHLALRMDASGPAENVTPTTQRVQIRIRRGTFALGRAAAYLQGASSPLAETASVVVALNGVVLTLRAPSLIPPALLLRPVGGTALNVFAARDVAWPMDGKVLRFATGLPTVPLEVSGDISVLAAGLRGALSASSVAALIDLGSLRPAVQQAGSGALRFAQASPVSGFERFLSVVRCRLAVQILDAALRLDSDTGGEVYPSEADSSEALELRAAAIRVVAKRVGTGAVLDSTARGIAVHALMPDRRFVLASFPSLAAEANLAVEPASRTPRLALTLRAAILHADQPVPWKDPNLGPPLASLAPPPLTKHATIVVTADWAGFFFRLSRGLNRVALLTSRSSDKLRELRRRRDRGLARRSRQQHHQPVADVVTTPSLSLDDFVDDAPPARDFVAERAQSVLERRRMASALSSSAHPRSADLNPNPLPSASPPRLSSPQEPYSPAFPVRGEAVFSSFSSHSVDPREAAAPPSGASSPRKSSYLAPPSSPSTPLAEKRPRASTAPVNFLLSDRSSPTIKEPELVRVRVLSASVSRLEVRIWGSLDDADEDKIGMRVCLGHASSSMDLFSRPSMDLHPFQFGCIPVPAPEPDEVPDFGPGEAPKFDFVGGGQHWFLAETLVRGGAVDVCLLRPEAEPRRAVVVDAVRIFQPQLKLDRGETKSSKAVGMEKEEDKKPPQPQSTDSKPQWADPLWTVQVCGVRGLVHGADRDALFALVDAYARSIIALVPTAAEPPWERLAAPQTLRAKQPRASEVAALLPPQSVPLHPLMSVDVRQAQVCGVDDSGRSLGLLDVERFKVSVRVTAAAEMEHVAIHVAGVGLHVAPADLDEGTALRGLFLEKPLPMWVRDELLSVWYPPRVERSDSGEGPRVESEDAFGMTHTPKKPIGIACRAVFQSLPGMAEHLPVVVNWHGDVIPSHGSLRQVMSSFEAKAALTVAHVDRRPRAPSILVPTLPPPSSPYDMSTARVTVTLEPLELALDSECLRHVSRLATGLFKQPKELARREDAALSQRVTLSTGYESGSDDLRREFASFRASRWKMARLWRVIAELASHSDSMQYSADTPISPKTLSPTSPPLRRRPIKSALQTSDEQTMSLASRLAEARVALREEARVAEATRTRVGRAIDAVVSAVRTIPNAEVSVSATAIRVVALGSGRETSAIAILEARNLRVVSRVTGDGGGHMHVALGSLCALDPRHPSPTPIVLERHAGAEPVQSPRRHRDSVAAARAMGLGGSSVSLPSHSAELPISTATTIAEEPFETEFVGDRLVLPSAIERAALHRLEELHRRFTSIYSKHTEIVSERSLPTPVSSTTTGRFDWSFHAPSSSLRLSSQKSFRFAPVDFEADRDISSSSSDEEDEEDDDHRGHDLYLSAVMDPPVGGLAVVRHVELEVAPLAVSVSSRWVVELTALLSDTLRDLAPVAPAPSPSRAGFRRGFVSSFSGEAGDRSEYGFEGAEDEEEEEGEDNLRGLQSKLSLPALAMRVAAASVPQPWAWPPTDPDQEALQSLHRLRASAMESSRLRHREIRAQISSQQIVTMRNSSLRFLQAGELEERTSFSLSSESCASAVAEWLVAMDTTAALLGLGAAVAAVLSVEFDGDTSPSLVVEDDRGRFVEWRERALEVVSALAAFSAAQLASEDNDSERSIMAVDPDKWLHRSTEDGPPAGVCEDVRPPPPGGSGFGVVLPSTFLLNVRAAGTLHSEPTDASDPGIAARARQSLVWKHIRISTITLHLHFATDDLTAPKTVRAITQRSNDLAAILSRRILPHTHDPDRLAAFLSQHIVRLAASTWTAPTREPFQLVLPASVLHAGTGSIADIAKRIRNRIAIDAISHGGKHLQAAIAHLWSRLVSAMPWEATAARQLLQEDEPAN